MHDSSVGEQRNIFEQPDKADEELIHIEIKTGIII